MSFPRHNALCYGLIHGGLAFRQPTVLLCLVHDAAFQLHAGKRVPVLQRVVALVGHHRHTLLQVRFLQRRCEVLYVAPVGGSGLLGNDKLTTVWRL